MKWTPENMNVLWETLFETHDLTIDVDKMAATWPTPHPDDEKPTPRAIKERLEKFRRNLKNGGSSITFSMGTKRAGGPSPESPQKTPPKKKKRVSKKAVPGKGNVASEEKGSLDGDRQGGAGEQGSAGNVG
ncbi:uncharacterized protein BP01DRAFT_385596 [Aspergillus saccharolyticus JOP 1030-1]|uniref:Uncharacterized protein n=1 Tax=Aspergillus saccharolyticus JOP 1030-1 TaxID=1450539 RepID=A0A318ZQ86_9EURO|nr:hypothetical protein BP01DRAFT_385596 [Aspergillus saccharolyticus JOP 1030-1]PYH42278.1 hypothetical protein BP01DRAFT_385596 [Aspergillus saccharolyticus JOP 1030-1]